MEADAILRLVISCESFTQQTTDDSHELLSFIFSETYETFKMLSAALVIGDLMINKRSLCKIEPAHDKIYMRPTKAQKAKISICSCTV